MEICFVFFPSTIVQLKKKKYCDSVRDIIIINSCLFIERGLFEVNK